MTGDRLVRRWRYPIGRLRALLWRFRTLPYAEQLFRDARPPKVLARPFCGFTLHVDVTRSSTHQLLYLEGRRFVAEADLIASLVRPGMRVVDVGANLGYYALLFESLVGSTGAIECFEPEPSNLDELRRNIRENRFANVMVHAMALGDEDGWTKLAPGVNGIVDPTRSAGMIDVPIRRLDSELSARVDLIKVDVEGYEWHVLAGAAETLRRDRPALLIEVHPELIPPPHDVDALLGLLRPLYSSLEPFGPAQGEGPFAKVASRYGLSDACRRFPSLEELLAACRRGERRDPFWLVCRARSW